MISIQISLSARDVPTLNVGVFLAHTQNVSNINVCLFFVIQQQRSCYAVRTEYFLRSYALKPALVLLCLYTSNLPLIKMSERGELCVPSQGEDPGFSYDGVDG